MRQYTIDWVLTYRDGKTLDGSTILRAESESEARGRLDHRRVGVYRIKAVHDNGEVEPSTKPFTCTIPSVKLK